MGRLTQQERATLKDLTERAKAEDAADATYELTVETANGHKIKLTGEKARKYAAKHGLELDDEEEDEEEDEDELEDEGEPQPRHARRSQNLPADPAPGGDSGYFRRR